MKYISFDVFCSIISKRDILSPADVTAVMLTCKQFYHFLTQYMISPAVLAGGYPQRSSILATFTCYCKRSGWNILTTCECYICCSLCNRRLPIKLASYLPGV